MGKTDCCAVPRRQRERYGTDNLYRGVCTLYLDVCGEREKRECWDREKKERGKAKQDGCKTRGCSPAAWKARGNNYVKVQARERKKRKRGGTVQTGTTRARHVRPRKATDLPAISLSLDQRRLAQPTLTYNLRQQRPGTYRPSGLVKLLHNDNVVLTQECSYRRTATTATPAVTSIFDEDRRRAGRGRRTSAVLLPGPKHYYVSTSSANDTIVTAASSGGQPWRRREAMTMMKDGGALTLTFPVDGEAVDRALVRLPPATVSC